MYNGVLAGYPVDSLKVDINLMVLTMQLIQINYHLKLLLKWHLNMHVQKQTQLLEPIMSAEVVTPEEYMGDVIG